MSKKALTVFSSVLVLLACVPAPASATIVPCDARIGDRVWIDADGDGTQGSTEVGIAGVTLALVNASGATVATAVTDQDGYYEFTTACANTPYTVRVTGGVPAGFVPTIVGSRDGNDLKPLDSNDPSGTTVTLPTSGGAKVNPTIDFGYVPPCEGTIGDFVWVDRDRDGTQDLGEPGVTGVSVALLAGNQWLQTAITDGAGKYEFTGVCPGTYTVKVTAGVPMGFSPTVIGGGDQVGDDSNNPNGATVSLPATGGANADPTIDFGYVPPCDGTIGDFVWVDRNRDGLQSVGEPGIAEVRVQLFNAAGTMLLQTSVTDGTGKYEFTGVCPYLPYAVKVTAGVPADFVPTTVASANGNDLLANDSNDPAGTSVMLTEQTSANPTLDFGYVAPCDGTIGDFVWEDLDRDGIQDNGELGISGFTVTLFGALNQVVQTANTAANGGYQFSGICPFIPYTVKVTGVLAGYLPTLIGSANGNDLVPNDSNDPAGTTVTLTEETSANPTLDFGYFRPAALGDFVWEDRNANGIQDAGEPPVSGATVTLTDCSGAEVTDAFGNSVQPVTTNGTGEYVFTNLKPGQYRVTVTLPGGYTFTQPFQGGNVALDSNVNPGTGQSDCRTLTSGQNDDTVDAGAYRAASLGNFVWQDANANDVQDGGEPGIPGAVVTLTDCSGAAVTDRNGSPVGPVTTGASGLYQFTNLKPGQYRVTVTLPGGYTFTQPFQGGNVALDSNVNPGTGQSDCRTLTSGQNDDTVDAGAYQPTAIGDFVWHDLNVNGQQDSGEPGLAGSTVTLWRCGPDGQVGGGDDVNTGQSVVTSASGAYLFGNLTPGCYFVTFTTPAGGFTPTAANVGNDATDSDAADGTTGAYVLVAGVPILTVDAGFYRPASLGDFVWEDRDGDGQQDGNEPGINGVEVKLYKLTDCSDPNSGVFQTSQTTANLGAGDGSYLFTNLVPGCYSVEFGTLPNYTRTVADTGADATDSDANVATGRTGVYTLASGGTNLTVDAGLLPPPQILIKKYTNGDDADSPTGPFVTVGGAVNWSYVVTNTGNVVLHDVVVTDNRGVAVSCPKTTLAAGEVMTCTATGTAVPGQYSNIGSVTGTSPDNRTATDDDPSHYFGAQPAIDLIKYVNDDDANAPTGPVVAAGSTVTFRFVVTNTGNVTLAPVAVTDSVYGAICTIASLAPGASEACTKTAQAAAGQHANVGTATGTPPAGVTPSPVIDTDPGNYFAYVPAACSVELTKQCAVVPAPPTSNFVCSDAKPIDQMSVIWNGSQAVWVKAYNGAMSGPVIQTFANVASGQEITFSRVGTGSYPNDIYFEIFTDASMSAASKLGNSTFHLSCSDVDMTGADDCGKAAGDGKGLSGYLNAWKFDGMAGNGQVLECSPTPPVLNWDDSCQITPQPNPSCTTEGKPTSLTFKYVPADCSTNNNPQGGKYTCSGSVPGSPATITSTTSGLVISPNPVAAGQEFTVTGSFGADTKFTIGGTQTLNIHTSCSQVLEVGNVFASMQLVAFNGDRGGTRVAYRYVVKNNSNGVFTYNLVDKVDATTVNQYLNQSLAGGGTATFDNFVAMLNTTTTNTATVTGSVGMPPNQASCQATDSVTVTVPPTPPCSLTTATPAPTTKDKQLRWSITNGGSGTVTLRRVTVMWPATNGYLSKVKLDGDNSWDGTINCVGGTCFANITADMFVADVNKKSIKAGDTRLFALEFQNNASTDLSKYVVAIDFGGGCTLSYNAEPPTCSAGLTIGDYVWFDADNDGIQDNGEPPVADVPLTLKALNGAVVGTATTGTDGKYSFSGTNVCAGGTYLVSMEPPAGYGPAIANAPGSATENDSNPNPSVVTLAANQNNPTIDFGLTDGISYCPTSPMNGVSTVGTLFVKAYDTGELIPASAGFPWSGVNPFGRPVVLVRYDQSFAVNDNTYGTGSSWGHRFSDLVGSDMAQFALYDRTGAKLLEFKIDTISASAAAPSGYASLGASGGEGGILSGNGAWVMDATTAIDANLNDYGYCTGGATGNCRTTLLVNSGPSPNTVFAGNEKFSLINAFYAVIDAAAFGGLTNLVDPANQVRLITQHNSPAKVSSFTPTVCQ